ncbi:MAG: hypothetical protein ABWX96_15005 [Propionibacteriaceae bacterium]
MVTLGPLGASSLALALAEGSADADSEAEGADEEGAADEGSVDEGAVLVSGVALSAPQAASAAAPPPTTATKPAVRRTVRRVVPGACGVRTDGLGSDMVGASGSGVFYGGAV